MAICLVVATMLSGSLSNNASSQSPSTLPHHSLATMIRSYFATINAAVHSGDMSSLATVYAPNATVTVSGLDGVPHVYRGLAQIKHFWKQAAKVRGLRYHEDRLLLLDTIHAAAYEHASATKESLFGRCAHLFVIVQDRIVTDSYITLPLYSTTLRAPIKTAQGYRW
jgi:hypothetical protein